MLKAVVDTSVFVAGCLSRTGKGYSSQNISRWRAGDFQLVMSRQILDDAKHLLALKHHRGTQIVEPELFLRALDS